MSQPTTLVTIHCLVYNHEPYLRDCLEGFVMQQTNFPFVAIVHDDASTDGSAAIIREYEEKYPDIIKPIYETENQYSKRDGSLTRIMNTAIDATGAKYVAMCEGDDYWTDPLKLQKQVDFLEANPEYGLCYTDYDMCDENGNLTHKSCFEEGYAKPILSFEEHLFRQGYIAPMTWLFRRDVYESFQHGMLAGTSDGSYVVALEFFYNSKVAFLPYTTATYRVHQGSASRPTSLHNFFKYRKSVYDTEKEYVRRYIQNEWILTFIIRQEIYELYPLAYKLGLQDYIEWSHNVSLMNPLIQLYYPNEMIRLEKEIVSARSSKAYRLGKFILAPFKKIKQLFKL